MKKIIPFLFLMLVTLSAIAQQSSSVEMADALRASGKIYVVVAVLVVIFVGLALYLFSIDRRLKKLERN